MALISVLLTDGVPVTEAFARVINFNRYAADSILLFDDVSRFNTIPPKARALDDKTVRVDFGYQAQNNAALSDPASYSIVPISPGAALVTVLGVSLPLGQSTPTFAELTVTEMTDVKLYALTLGSGVQGAGGEISEGQSVFAAIGRAPEVLLVLAISKNTVQVHFSEVMEDNPDLRNPANYLFDGGLVVESVVAAEGSVVTLATTDQAEGQLYHLTIRGLLAASIRDSVVAADATAVM
jgi:hypothetical protein